MRSIRLGLLNCAVAGVVGMFVVVGCSADGATDPVDPVEDVDSGNTDPGNSSSGSVIPEQDSGSEPVDSGGTSKDAGKDSGSKDSGTKDGSTTDSGATTAPTPGTACTTQDQIVSRMCGMCGKQEAICQPTDNGLVWSDYGVCKGEAGECLPGDTAACGNCGTRTCTNTCSWGACGGQPQNSCSPGSVSYTTAGCPGGGFKARTCGTACQWGNYANVCKTPNAVDLWSGGPGGYSTFMRSSDGTTYAWGLDANGQLGDGDTSDKPRMVPTPFMNIKSLHVGGGTTYGFSCAAFDDGSAKCWGYNSTSYGLGDGNTSTSLTGVTPTGFDANVVKMVAGYAHGCGLFADGSAKCWGYNTYGQLGNGNTTNQKSPVAVNLTGISQLGSGYYTVCAIKNGAAFCWGYNSDGQVGDGTTTARSTPTQVIASGVAQVAPGYYHSCATMTNGTAKCWGENVNGEIGDGNGSSGADDVTTPKTVVGINGTGTLSDVAEVCTGYGTSCARLNDGRVACWGRNADGQLGAGDSSSMSNVPKLVVGVTGATKLACGYKHACVVDSTGNVKCWGDNGYGQVGNNGMPTDAVSAQLTTF